MSRKSELAGYFSHSWHPDHLPVNLRLWELAADHCHLLIDQPVQEMGDESPPWYISRIESLMRRSDVFIACIPPASKGVDETRDGDWKVRCSPYILFETRMAERVGLPRFVLYDRTSRFRPPDTPSRHARYVPCRMAELVARLRAGRDGDAALGEFADWLAWLDGNILPARETERMNWACLVAGDNADRKRKQIREVVMNAGFDEPVELDRGYRSDAELSSLVRSLSLLVADISRPSTSPLYHFAHSMNVPSIRLDRRVDESTDRHLPAILQGHPVGYQCDMLPRKLTDETLEEIRLRAEALLRIGTPIVSVPDGRYELQQRGYRRHLVFVSHNQPPSGRELVNAICRHCRDLGIDFWEYEERNKSGQHWEIELDDALGRMTHFVPLLSETYEQSPMCLHELAAAKDRRADDLVVLPFLLGNRKRPNPDLRGAKGHHQRLFVDRSDDENARAVVQQILIHVRR